LIAALAAFTVLPSHAQDRPGRILYFTHTAGYRHEVIPASRDVLKKISAVAGFEVTASEDVTAFTAENLQHYGAVMFFTTGELPMSNAQQVAFLDFVRRGGGFLGVHSATDTFYRWPEYHLGADWLDRLELLILGHRPNGRISAAWHLHRAHSHMQQPQHFRPNLSAEEIHPSRVAAPDG
jgi:hypothetical protein